MKEAISITLSPDNLVWLRVRTAALGHRSVSELIDRLVTDARGRAAGAPRSIVGTARLAPDDEDLSTADDAVRAQFAAVLDDGRYAAAPGGVEGKVAERSPRFGKTRR